MRGDTQQHLALRKRFAYQAKLVMLQVAQPAVDQLAAGPGRAAAQVSLLAQRDIEPTAGCISGDADAVDTAADHQQVKYSVMSFRHGSEMFWLFSKREMPPTIDYPTLHHASTSILRFPPIVRIVVIVRPVGEQAPHSPPEALSFTLPGRA